MVSADSRRSWSGPPPAQSGGWTPRPPRGGPPVLPRHAAVSPIACCAGSARCGHACRPTPGIGPGLGWPKALSLHRVDDRGLECQPTRRLLEASAHGLMAGGRWASGHPGCRAWRRIRSPLENGGGTLFVATWAFCLRTPRGRSGHARRRAQHLAGRRRPGWAGWAGPCCFTTSWPFPSCRSGPERQPARAARRRTAALGFGAGGQPPTTLRPGANRRHVPVGGLGRP